MARGLPAIWARNSEYDEAKEQQGKLYSRIAELEDINAARGHRGREQRPHQPGDHRLQGDGGRQERQGPAPPTGSWALRRPTHERHHFEELPFGKALINAKGGDEVGVEAPPEAPSPTPCKKIEH